jgi:D-glycero-D-manno-heptose 1,7-bisphosphate phosphatase
MPLSLIDQCLDTNGLWSQLFGHASQFLGRGALFLDRDGVIVQEVNYLHRSQDVRMINGVGEVIHRANQAGIPVIVITNQAGIGRRYYAWEQFVEVQEQIAAELAVHNAKIDAVFACPHHVDARAPYQHDDHPARKPNPGMMYMARDSFGIALERSWIVGDRAIDIRAGRNAGLMGGTHVRTGHGGRVNERETALALATDTFQVRTAESIADLLRDTTLFKGLLAADRRQ